MGFMFIAFKMFKLRFIYDLVIKGKLFLPAFSFGILIFIVSSLPSTEIKKIQSINIFFWLIFYHYFQHFFVFGIFTFLLCYGFYKRKESSFSYLKVGLCSILYGLFIELYQSILSYRSFSLKDLLCNLAGVIFSLIIFKIFVSRRK